MSFVDLATLTMHRRSELEGRINILNEKCDRAINDIQKVKMQAQSFGPQLNCEPAELKERFLSYMKKLDEYMYLITDFNLAIGQLEELNTHQTPVQDSQSSVQSIAANYSFNPKQGPYNLMDALSEATPSTSTACANLCPPEKPERVKVPKKDQVLIAFSSTSSSSESVPSRKSEMVTKEVQCSLVEGVKNLKLEDAAPLEPCNLPAQTLLEVDQAYEGTIMTIDGGFFWVITDDVDEVRSLMTDMTSYYKGNYEKLTTEQLKSISCCAYYDEDTDCYYRALFLKEAEDEPDKVELFVVDTGEIRASLIEWIKPLDAQFCIRAPYARCCYLAGLEQNCSKEMLTRRDLFMKKYVGVPCAIEVDDNTSEALGVYIVLASGETLNDIMLRRGLALPIEKSPEQTNSIEENVEVCGPPEVAASISDVTEGPEYDDPVEAVTGYHNRDEADICKHYKGGPEKTCFKGPRCTKKHVMKHPDGWTLDRVEVVAKVISTPLPAPGQWLKILVTNVCHFDRVYVQIRTDKPTEEVPDFGVVLPPMTLDSLFRDMNSPATKYAYKPLELTPAPGELVAALYPADKCWYRAKVLTVTRADQNVEVQYIDYGTVLWVKEDNVRQLPPRFTLLASQAVRCVLAGVVCSSHDSKQWAAAKQALSDLVLDHNMECHVISRDYDEITVDIYDQAGYSVTEQLAARNLVQLVEYSVIDDHNITQKLVVP